jgi:hypothetical protein
VELYREHNTTHTSDLGTNLEKVNGINCPAASGLSELKQDSPVIPIPSFLAEWRSSSIGQHGT